MEFWRFIFAGLFIAFILAGCTQPGISGNETNATSATHEETCVGASSPNSSVAGSILASGVTYSDACVGDAAVRKYYCSGNKSATTTIQCDEGEKCKSGACVKEQPSGTTSQGKDCIETDNVKDYYQAGSVAYGGAVYNDTCQGAYDVLEYYCENDTMKQGTYHCPTGDKCDNGACSQQGRTCQDSDSSNQSNAGSTTLYGGGMVISISYDSCSDNSTVKEYGCKGGNVSISYTTCPENQYCYRGSCTEICKEYSGAGGSGILLQEKFYMNSCQGNSTLLKYTCSGNELSSEEESCGNMCYLGKCLSDSDVKCQRAINGVNILYGSAIVSWKTNECLDFTSAKTYICDKNKVATIYKSCTDNEVCQNGSCNKITSEGCYEFNGRDIHVKSGVAMTTIQSILTTNYNFCFTGKILAQYYCDGTDQKVDYISCPREETCSDGVCVYPYTCTQTTVRDSDTAGSVSLYEGSKFIRKESDLCTGDPAIVQQVSCGSDGSVVYTNVRCYYGTKCDIPTGTCK